MTASTKTIQLPQVPDLSYWEFRFESERNEAVRSANRELIRERFPHHWTVVYDGGKLAAFDDPQEFLGFLRSLGRFAEASASARPPWSTHDRSLGPLPARELTEQMQHERERNSAFWDGHREQLVSEHPHEYIVVYGGGEVAILADKRELWVLQDDCDRATWNASLWSPPRKPKKPWLHRQPRSAIDK